MEMLPRAAGDALVALHHANQHRRAAEVAEIVAITRAVELYEVNYDDVWAGVEKLITCGYEGTPLVGEFLALEIAGVLGISQATALARIGDVLNVKHRHPSVWETFLEGELWWWQAAQISQACSTLDAQAVALVERHIRHALGIMRFTQLMHHLPGWVVEADPRRAAQRARLARTALRMVVEPIHDGHCDVHGRLSPEDAAAFDHAISHIAGDLPDPTLPEDIDLPQPEITRYLHDARRAAAVGQLARTAAGQDALPTHQLIVHVNAETSGHHARLQLGGVATVEKWGHVLTTELPQFLRHSRVLVRPVIDPNALPAVDPHDPPDSMRLALTVRNPWDVFPHSTRPARSCDADHTRAYVDGVPGQTGMGNLGPLSRRAHRAKTHGGWRLTQPQPGTFHWQSPAGFQYLVTAGGTTLLTIPQEHPPDQPPEDHGAPLREPPAMPPDPPPDHPAWLQAPLPETEAWVRSIAGLSAV